MIISKIFHEYFLKIFLPGIVEFLIILMFIISYYPLRTLL